MMLKLRKREAREYIKSIVDKIGNLKISEMTMMSRLA